MSGSVVARAMSGFEARWIDGRGPAIASRRRVEVLDVGLDDREPRVVGDRSRCHRRPELKLS